LDIIEKTFDFPEKFRCELFHFLFVISTPAIDHLCSVYLLTEHQTHELMRQREPTERELHIGTCEHLV
jgi:hypothetical protein